MSLEGASFSSDLAAGAYLSVSAGNASSLFTGAYTIATLIRMTSGNGGLIAGYSGGTAGTQQQAFSVDGNKIFGSNDFSSGYAPVTYNDGQWRWLIISKKAGNTHYRMHVGDIWAGTPTWYHGESVGSANQPNKAAIDTITLGRGWYPLGYGVVNIAVQVVWTTELSDSALEAACTKAAADLLPTSPTAGWLFEKASVSSSIVDFTGGGANETARQFIVAGNDPAGFDFALPPPETITPFRASWTPALIDVSDTGNFGFVFSANQTVKIKSIGFYRTSAGTPVSTIRGALWDPASPSTALADTGSTSIAGAALDAWVDIDLPTPYTLAPGNTIAASVLIATAGSLGYGGSDLASSITDGVLTIPSNGGRFTGSTSPAYPSNAWTGMHGVRVSYSLTGGAVNGSATSSETITFTAGGQVGKVASSSLPATATVAAQGSVGVSQAASVAASVAITAQGSMGVSKAASPLSATATITAQGETGVGKTATLAASVSLTAQGLVGPNAPLALGVTAQITAQGRVAQQASASLAASVQIVALSRVDGQFPDPPAELRLDCRHEVSLRWVP